MAWRIITEEDLAATISQKEIDAFRRDASTSGADAVGQLLKRTAGFVRIYLRSNSAVRLSSNEDEIPEGLISPACAIAAYDVLKRLPLKVGEDRKAARDDALALLDKIADGRVNVESPDEETASTTVASTPGANPATPTRLLD